MRHHFKAAAFVLASMLVATAAWSQEKPNIVFIFMDNFGYGELGVYGGGITRGGADVETLSALGGQAGY